MTILFRYKNGQPLYQRKFDSWIELINWLVGKQVVINRTENITFDFEVTILVDNNV